jgi:hypothetical protein
MYIDVVISAVNIFPTKWRGGGNHSILGLYLIPLGIVPSNERRKKPISMLKKL